MKTASRKLFLAWRILRVTYGLLFILVGTDKFLNTLTQWNQFMGSAAQSLPFAPMLILKGFALLQIIAGILLFTPWIFAGIYLMMALLVIIFFNLITASSGIVVIAHDIIMMVGVYVLWQLTRMKIKNSWSMQ